MHNVDKKVEMYQVLPGLSEEVLNNNKIYYLSHEVAS